MIPAKDVNYKNAKEMFGELIEAIPKSKRPLMFYQMCAVEMTLDDAMRLLVSIREYFIDNGQTSGGFVDKIDKLVPKEEMKYDIPVPDKKKVKK